MAGPAASSQLKDATVRQSVTTDSDLRLLGLSWASSGFKTLRSRPRGGSSLGAKILGFVARSHLTCSEKVEKRSPLPRQGGM